jgi:hypothetical protein
VAAQFFNFKNEETYHFFKWVSESGVVDPAGMIRDAYQRLETAVDELTEQSLGLCYAARDQLADLLVDVLHDDLPGDRSFLGPQIGQVGRNAESLWGPLLALALNRVDCHAAAEALLIQAGKWAPIKETPEIE